MLGSAYAPCPQNYCSPGYQAADSGHGGLLINVGNRWESNPNFVSHTSSLFLDPLDPSITLGRADSGWFDAGTQGLEAYNGAVLAFLLTPSVNWSTQSSPQSGSLSYGYCSTLACHSALPPRTGKMVEPNCQMVGAGMALASLPDMGLPEAMANGLSRILAWTGAVTSLGCVFD